MAQPATPNESRHAPELDYLRATIARIERVATPVSREALPFGIAAIDGVLPQGGLLPGALHEVMGAGPGLFQGAAAAAFAAGIMARLHARTSGTVLWVTERGDVFAPGLAAAGLHPDRVIYAETGAGAGRVLLTMEEGLRHRGLAGVVGELAGRLSLTASRRLQLAAEASGVMALVLRRPREGKPFIDEPTAAVTKWRVGPLPAGPPLPWAPDVPGVGRARWRLELLRSRGGRTGTWIVEACDAAGGLDLVAPLENRPAVPRRAA